MTAPKGGRRPGAGRKPGSINKKSKAFIEAAEASGIVPLDYMLAVLRDEARSHDDRMKAATAAAPYLHARLNATTVNADLTITHEQALAQLDD